MENNKEFLPMINNEERNIVEKLINEHEIKMDNFHIVLSGNRYISGVFGNIDSKLKKVFKYNHFLESINDLSKKTKLSIENCVACYQKVNIKNFNPIGNKVSDEEEKAYYYMENALFREIILWDSLAQLYNLYYDMNINVERIFYKKVIKKLSQENTKDIDFEELLRYLDEPFEFDADIDKGIHECINEIRNQMTHRFSIAVTAFSENSEEGSTLRAMPDLVYKIAKDYNMVKKHLVQIIDLIYNEIVGILQEGVLPNS